MDYIANLLENKHSDNDDIEDDKRERSEEELKRINELLKKEEEDNKKNIINICHRYNRTLNHVDILKKALYNGDVDLAFWMYTYIRKNKIKFNIHDNFDYIFRELCKRNKCESIKVILKFNSLYSFNISYNKDEAFRSSCLTGNIELVKYLFYLDSITDKENINIHSEDNYAIRHACILGYSDIVRLLLSHDTIRSFELEKNNNYIYMYTFISGHVMLSNFISNYLDHNILLVDMCKKGYLAIVDYILTNKTYRIDLFYNNNSPFIEACKSNMELAKYFIDYNRNVIHYGNDIALRELCYSGNLKMVKWLLNQDDFNKFDLTYNNNEIFVFSCINGKLDIAKFLLPLFDKEVIDIHYDDDYLIKATYENKKYNVAKWLLTLDTIDNFNIDINDYPKL